MPNEQVNFNPGRLSLARRARGITKIELAKRVGLDRRTLTGYESGTISPSLAALRRLGGVLDFPDEFFFGEDLDEPNPSAVSFRAMSRMTAAQQDRANSIGAFAFALSRWIDQRLLLPKVDLPDFSRETDPEAAAISLRHSWGQGEHPIKNMVHLLESKGVRVFSLALEAREVDAYSTWHGDTPFILLNLQKSAERSRFDAAHELGHLVLHRHGGPQQNAKVAEREADTFAAAFLMPRTNVMTFAPKVPTIPNLTKHKKRWGVSLSALVRRMKDVGLLSDWQYRSLNIEIAKRGYRTSEPESMPRESSGALAKILESLRQDGCGRREIAQQLMLSERDLDNLMFGLVMTALPGGKTSATPGQPAGRGQLKIVDSRE